MTCPIQTSFCNDAILYVLVCGGGLYVLVCGGGLLLIFINANVTLPGMNGSVPVKEIKKRHFKEHNNLFFF